MEIHCVSGRARAGTGTHNNKRTGACIIDSNHLRSVSSQLKREVHPEIKTRSLSAVPKESSPVREKKNVSEASQRNSPAAFC